MVLTNSTILIVFIYNPLNTNGVNFMETESQFGVTPEVKKQQDITTGELLKRGANYDNAGNLLVTEEANVIESAHAEMEAELLGRKLREIFTLEELSLINL